MTQSINFENGDETFNIDLDADGNLNFNANDVDGGGDRRLVINDDSGEITIGETIFLRGADGSVNALAGRFDGKVEINTEAEDGVTASSASGRGVVGTSRDQAGVLGLSNNFVGVFGETQRGDQPGVFGKGPTLAGRFDGKVEITGADQGSEAAALVVSVRGTPTRVSITRSGMTIDGGQIHGSCFVTGFMRIDAGLHVTGETTVRGDLKVDGGLEVLKNTRVVGGLAVLGNKNFVQDHPIDRTKEIVYTSLEGGEAGTYTRGMTRLLDGQAEIQLPEHFGLVTTTEGLTMHLTSHGKYLQLYVSELSTTRCVVREAQGRSGNFYYLIQGVRKGQENYSVIRTKEVSTLARQQAAYPNPNSH